MCQLCLQNKIHTKIFKWLTRLAMPQPTRLIHVLSTLWIVCSCISPMPSRLLSFKAVILSGLTLIFDGTPQIIVQLCQFPAPKWPTGISSVADNAIFKSRAPNIECTNKQEKSFRYPPSSIFVDKKSLKNVPIMPLDQDSHQNSACGFCAPNGQKINQKCPNYASGKKFTRQFCLFELTLLFFFKYPVSIFQEIES